LSRTLHTDTTITYEVGIDQYAQDLFFSAYSQHVNSIVNVFQFSRFAPNFTTIASLTLDQLNASNNRVIKLFTPIPGTSSVAYTASEKLILSDYYCYGIITHLKNEALLEITYNKSSYEY